MYGQSETQRNTAMQGKKYNISHSEFEQETYKCTDGGMQRVRKSVTRIPAKQEKPQCSAK
ncbi:unnamed protein product, partial [Ceratitis capitata]